MKKCKRITIDEFMAGLTPDKIKEFEALMDWIYQKTIVPDMVFYKNIPGYMGEFKSYFRLFYANAVTKYYAAVIECRWVDGELKRLYSSVLAFDDSESQSIHKYKSEATNVSYLSN